MLRPLIAIKLRRTNGTSYKLLCPLTFPSPPIGGEDQGEGEPNWVAAVPLIMRRLMIRNGWAEIFQRSQEFSWLKILIPLPMYCKPEIIVKKAVPQTRKSIKRGKGNEYLEKRE
jgi:hypothetical protein